MNVLLLTSHSIAEHDDLDMFTRMGVPVYSIGGAYDPVRPFEGMRPALPDVIRYPELEAATEEQRARLSADLGDPGPAIDWGKARLAPAVIDWADVIIVHHFPEMWIGGQWDAIRDKRVVWRTCGQSDVRLEHEMLRYAREGMQIVRYSHAERSYFSAAGVFAGEDDCIYFGKDVDEWTGWRGDAAVVGNLTQHMRQRGDACGYLFWEEATTGLPVRPAGPGSEAMRGGIGRLDYEAMREYLRSVQAYLYTGTRPASYTLGLIEAQLTGTPIVTMSARYFAPSGLWEARHLVEDFGFGDHPADANRRLRALLADEAERVAWSQYIQGNARARHGFATIIPQWRAFLGLSEPDEPSYFGGDAA